MKKWALLTLIGTSSLFLFASQPLIASGDGEVLTLEALLSSDYEAQVNRYIKQYQSSSPERTEELLLRMQEYFPMIEYKLDKAGLPLHLKYITLVESRLISDARSRVGATGLWQLMVPTARYCGLSVDSWVDERLDPERSTDAAIYYFQDLYRQFEDWALVMAAYNAGPGRVRQAIRRAGSNDFNKVIRFLPRETRKYVPRFLAAKSYIENHSSFNYITEPISPDVWWTTKIFLDERTSLVDVAFRLNLDLDVLRKLNSSWRRSYVGKSQGKYFLRIPERLLPVWWESVGIAEGKSEIDKTELNSEIPIYSGSTYQELYLPIRRHRSLRELAEDVGFNPYRLARWNSISLDAILAAGESIRLILPVDHDCEERLIHLFYLEKELVTAPPSEIRELHYPPATLEAKGPKIHLVREVGANKTEAPILPSYPQTIREEVFVNILQRRKRKTFPFNHKQSLEQDWVYSFPAN